LLFYNTLYTHFEMRFIKGENTVNVAADD